MEQAAAQNVEPDNQSEEEKKSEGDEPELVVEVEQQEDELEEDENGHGSPVFNKSLSIDSFNKADLEELPVNQVHHSNITDAT